MAISLSVIYVLGMENLPWCLASVMLLSEYAQEKRGVRGVTLPDRLAIPAKWLPPICSKDKAGKKSNSEKKDVPFGCLHQLAAILLALLVVRGTGSAVLDMVSG